LDEALTAAAKRAAEFEAQRNTEYDACLHVILSHRDMLSSDSMPLLIAFLQHPNLPSAQAA